LELVVWRNDRCMAGAKEKALVAFKAKQLNFFFYIFLVFNKTFFICLNLFFLKKHLFIYIKNFGNVFRWQHLSMEPDVNKAEFFSAFLPK